MSRDVKSIQERLEDRADARLIKDVDVAALPLENLYRVGHSIYLDGYSTASGSKASIGELLNAIKGALVGHYRNKYRTEEIEEFMGEVASLRNRVAELESGLDS
jgi:hypothetical protein